MDAITVEIDAVVAIDSILLIHEFPLTEVTELIFIIKVTMESDGLHDEILK